MMLHHLHHHGGLSLTLMVMVVVIMKVVVASIMYDEEKRKDMMDHQDSAGRFLACSLLFFAPRLKLGKRLFLCCFITHGFLRQITKNHILNNHY